MKKFVFIAVLGLSACLALPGLTVAATTHLTVNLTDAAQSIYHVHMTMPVKPGPMTLYYPKWIPGDHAPVGRSRTWAG